MHCIGHRGLPLLFPENTVPSFLAALEAGADGVELDIRLTRDNEVVVMHDSTLDRTTNATGPIRAMNYSDLKKVKAINTYLGLEEYSMEGNVDLPQMSAPIPKLEDVFKVLLKYPRVTCIIDIKWDNPLSIMIHLTKILQNYQELHHRLTLGVWSILFVPFLPKLPVKRSFIGSSWILGMMMCPFVDTMSLDKDMILNNLKLTQCLRKIRTVTTWTPDTVKDLKKLQGMVDGVISDFVPLAIEVMK